MLLLTIVLLDQQHVVALQQLGQHWVALREVSTDRCVVVRGAQAERASAEIGSPSSAIKARSTDVRMQVKLGVSRSV